MRHARLKFIFVPVDDVTRFNYGVKKDGVYNGYAGVVQRGSVDTVAIDFWPSPGRFVDFHISQPYALDTYAALVPHKLAVTYSPYEWHRPLKLFVQMFDIYLWLVLLVVFCSLYYLLPRCFEYIKKSLKWPKQPSKIYHDRFKTIGGLLAAFLMSFYQSLLLAAYVLPTNVNDIKDFTSLLRQVEMKRLDLGGKSELDNWYIKKRILTIGSSDERVQKFEQTIYKNPMVIISPFAELLKAIDRGTTSHFLSEMSAVEIVQNFCNIRQIRIEDMGYNPVVFLFNKFIVRKVLKRIDAAIAESFQHLQTMHMRYKNSYDYKSNCSGQQMVAIAGGTYYSLGLLQLSGALLMSLLGMIGAIIFFYYEYFGNIESRTKLKKRSKISVARVSQRLNNLRRDRAAFYHFEHSKPMNY